MTAKKTTPKTGRPTKYKAEFNERAYDYCLLGATDAQMADFFGTCERTINMWKKAHPEFLQSVTRGKVEADAKVAGSLFQRACGYTHPEERIFHHNGKTVRADTLKHYPPDTRAAEFWLKNRNPEMWREKVEVEQTIKTGFEDTPFHELTREQGLDLIRKAVNALPAAQRAALGYSFNIH